MFKYYHAIVFITAFCISASYCDEEVHRYDVIIVGAGAAGLSTGLKLRNDGSNNFLILEASERAGGRIMTRRFGDYLVDLGPREVTMSDDDPVYTISKNVALFFPSGDTASELRTIGGRRFDNETFDNIVKLFWDTITMESLIEHNGPYNELLESRLPKVYENYSASDAEIFIDLHKKKQKEYFCAELDDVGTAGAAEDGNPNNVEYLAWYGGYEIFVHILLGYYPPMRSDNLMVKDHVLYKKEVTKIEWAESGVDITCGDGSRYSADKAVITIPLGVLNQVPENFFSPPLPKKQQEAIHSLGYGIVEYIFLLFENKWWPDNSISFGMSNEAKENYKKKHGKAGWITEIEGFSYSTNLPLMLTVLVAGESAKEMLAATDDEVKTACYEILKELFDPEEYNVTMPTYILRTNWLNNPYAKGSAAYRSTRSDRKNITGEDLVAVYGANDKPILLFAGDAQHRYMYGTVTASVLSGLAAVEIMNKENNN